MGSHNYPVRIAVIGAGLIGHRHIQHIIDEPRGRLAGVIDPHPDAKVLAERAGTIYYSNIEPFLEKGHAEGVIIATPNETHTTIGIQCASAGLHLLVEKPIASEPAVPLESQLRHFCDVVRFDAEPRCSGEEGLKTLEATMAVAEAVRRCQPVAFD